MAVIPTGIGKIQFVERVFNAAPGASPVESIKMDNCTAMKIYDVAWNSRVAAAMDILGRVEKAGTLIKRILPLYHPEYGGATPYLWATGIPQIQGIGAPLDGNFKQQVAGTGAEVAEYHTARMTIQFETMPFQMPGAGEADAGAGAEAKDESNWTGFTAAGDPYAQSGRGRYVVRQSQPSGRYIPIPRGGMKFVNTMTDPKLRGQDIGLMGISAGKIVPMVEHHWTWKFVPANCVPTPIINPSLNGFAFGAIELTIGTVNSVKFNGAPAGTLLLTGVHIKPLYGYAAVTGQIMYDVEYVVLFNPFGHNNVPVNDAGVFTWAEITVDGVPHAVTDIGVHVYDGADYSNLFKAP